MNTGPETAALVALLRLGRRSPSCYADLIEQGRAPSEVLESELREDEHGQIALTEPDAAAHRLQAATEELEAWNRAGLTIKTVLDPDYPPNLRMVYDRPPLIFVAGRLRSEDRRAIAVIGTRRPSPQGIEQAQQLATYLTEQHFTVISGLAQGIDTAVHAATLARKARTIAVIGTGLAHAYPPENAPLQLEIAAEGAVVSQFWPDAPPTRATFPARNALMSGLALATVIVEAALTSGTRIQARKALAHGRPVFLNRALLVQPWASELGAKPGVYGFDDPRQVVEQLERLTETGSLVS